MPALGGGNRAIDLILWETAQARYLEQSATLAGFIEQALRPRIEMSPRAVQQAPFRVLVGANMPAALVEIGYLSNAEQETQLATAGLPGSSRAGAARRARSSSANSLSTKSATESRSIKLTSLTPRQWAVIVVTAIAAVAVRDRR